MSHSDRINEATHIYLCAPAAEARLAILACELQDSQWNVGGQRGEGQCQAPATENPQWGQFWHSQQSDNNVHPQEHTLGMFVKV